ncbi:unnamed protein product, partial [Sphenostylis stenocarpa]
MALETSHHLLEHRPRKHNDRIDILSKLTNTKKAGQHKTLLQEKLRIPSWDYDD